MAGEGEFGPVVAKDQPGVMAAVGSVGEKVGQLFVDPPVVAAGLRAGSAAGVRVRPDGDTLRSAGFGQGVDVPLGSDLQSVRLLDAVSLVRDFPDAVDDQSGVARSFLRLRS